MESLVTELVWLVTNYQAWVVGVLLFGDPHIWYRRYSFFENRKLRDPCAVQGRRYRPRHSTQKLFSF